MGRIQNDADVLMQAIRQRNVYCSTRFLRALIEHHGQIEEEALDEPDPDPEPQPEPAPEPLEAAVFPALHKVEVIKRAVCRQFNIPRNAIESASRKAGYVRPRQIAMYLVRKYSNHSYAEIGRRLGGRDHSTILHAFNKIERQRHQSPDLAAELEVLEAAIA